MTKTEGRPLATARRLATLMLAAVLGACALCLAAPQQEAQAESYKTLYTWNLSGADLGGPVAAENDSRVDLAVAAEFGLALWNNTPQEIPQSTLILYKASNDYPDTVSLPAIPSMGYTATESPWFQLDESDSYVRAELVVASDDPAGVYVTFDLNGHGKFPGNLVLQDDGTYREQLTNDMPIIAPTPTDDAYEFTGWADADGNLIEDFQQFETSVTVYAQWEPKPASDEPADGREDDGGNGNGVAGDDSDAEGDSDDEYVTSPATGVTAASAENFPAIPAAILTALLTAACAAAFALRKRLEA